MASVTRRRYLAGVVAIGAGAGTAACELPGLAAAPRPAAGGALAGTVRWSFWANDAQYAIIGEQLGLFRQQYPGIKVEEERTTGGKGPWNQKFRTQLAADDVPDVLMQDLEHLTSYGALGVLADLRPLTARDKLDTGDFFEAGLKGGQRAGKQVGLPRTLSVAPIYYNRVQVQERGLPLPTNANWTWDDLVDMARKLTREVQGQQRWGFSLYNEFSLTIASRIWQNGGEVLSADESKCLLDQKPAMDAVPWWYDLATKWHVAPTQTELAALEQEGVRGAPVFLIAAQRASMGSEGTWSPSTFNQTAGLDWDQQVWPVPRGGKRASAMNQNSVAVAAAAKVPDLAWELVKFVTGKQALETAAANALWVPPRKSVANSAAAQVGLGKGKNVKALFDELDAGRASVAGLARWPDVNRLLGPVLTRIRDGEPATTALPEVVRQINDVLRQPPA